MFSLAVGKAYVGALLASTVLVHGGKPYAPQPYTGWLASFAVPAPPGYVDFGIGRCATSTSLEIGCMDWTSPIATVRIERTDRLDRTTFAHEMGHVFDYYVLDQIGWRPRFAALTGRPWRTPYTEEYLADAYALCALYPRLQKPVTTGYGFRVTPKLHTRICALIRNAYASWLTTATPSARGQMLAPAPYKPPQP
jgi:hypothetical protein